MRDLAFQFHLVRLKAWVLAYDARNFFISIPFSTIKRTQIQQQIQAKAVFQFHLVRLKVVFRMTRTVFLKFQFHLVRLKDGNLYFGYAPQY